MQYLIMFLDKWWKQLSNLLYLLSIQYNSSITNRVINMNGLKIFKKKFGVDAKFSDDWNFYLNFRKKFNKLLKFITV